MGFFMVIYISALWDDLLLPHFTKTYWSSQSQIPNSSMAKCWSHILKGISLIPEGCIQFFLMRFWSKSELSDMVWGLSQST